MRVPSRTAAAWLLATGMFAFSASALATNGYFTHGVGPQSKGMAGTGVGSNANMGAIMTASNPALGVFVDDRWEAGLSIFSPRRSYTAGPSEMNGGVNNLGDNVVFCSPANPELCLPSHTIAEGKIDSSSEWFPIPYVAKNWSLANDANITGVFYGRGGMNTDWDDPNASATSYFCGGDPFAGEPPASGQGPYCRGVAGVDLMQAFFSVTYSAKVNDNFSWGIGPVIALQAFEAKGVSVFAPITETFVASNGATLPASLSDNGRDMSIGYGFSAGIWWGMTDAFSVGLAYQSKMTMDEFSDYSDLFAEQGGFDVPASTKFGASWLASDVLRVNFDIEYTQFGDVKSIANPMINLAGCPGLPLGGQDTSFCLGGNTGGGFGWEDMTTYKLGFEWQTNERNTWRFGYSYGEQPIQEADVLFNILAPGVMEQHLTVGWTTRRDNGGAWTFSFMYAPKNDVTGPSLFDPGDLSSGNPQPQQIKLEMSQLEFEVGFTF